MADVLCTYIKILYFNKAESYTKDTGEVNWLVQDAINKEIPIPVISQSIMELFKSRTKDSDTYKAIALMRHGFSGHPFGSDNYIAKEGKISRIRKIHRLFKCSRQTA
jgi:6-phosphogluconate dehydrogenase